MRRVHLFLSMAACVSAGCATNAATDHALPDLSVASLSASGEASAASGWSEVELDVPAPQIQQPLHPAETSIPGIATSP
jgi:hypothetical protein